MELYLMWISDIMANTQSTYLCCLDQSVWHFLSLTLALFKPQITVAICCQGDYNYNCQSFMANILLFTRTEVIWFMVPSVHSSHFNIIKQKCGLDLFWLEEY